MSSSACFSQCGGIAPSWESVPRLYSETLVGSSFEKFRNRKFQKKANLRQDQLERAQKSYQLLAQKSFEEQRIMLETLYSNAAGCRAYGPEELDFFVIGRNASLANIHTQCNFGVLSDEAGRAGAVFAPKKWSVLKNDVMLIGAIHAGKDCMIIQEDMQKFAISDFVNEKTGMPTIFAREVAILKAAGYIPVCTPAGTALICQNPQRAGAFTFEDAYEAGAVEKVDSLARFLNNSTLLEKMSTTFP